MSPPLAEPLTESELDRLDDFLCRVNHGKGMTLEGLDGFLCALICGPELVPSSEYLPHVWGGELIQGRGFDSIEQAQDFMSLLARHWNTIAGTLLRGDVHMPLVFEGENGIAMGNDWAIGFQQGMHLRPGSWDKLVEDDEHWAALAPMLVLAHEDDPDPEMRSKPLTPEGREELLRHMAVSVSVIYDFFRGRLKKVGRQREKRKKRVKN